MDNISINKTKQEGRRHPDWIKVRLPSGKDFYRLKALMRNAKLHTICEEALCPNIGECWSAGTATFLILGDCCTRHCRYCNVKSGNPNRVIDNAEPLHVAETILLMKLRYAVITSVTRDDLEDGGAGIFAETIKEIKTHSTKCRIEILTPDFKGSVDAVKTLLNEHPDVFAHNIETVKRLYPVVRKQGKYEWGLGLLKNIKKLAPLQLTKSSIMLGMGEEFKEVIETMRDLRKAGCDILTLGQYLQPSKKNLPVSKYSTPDEFSELKKLGLDMGFRFVHSGHLVRSSYHAERCVE